MEFILGLTIVLAVITLVGHGIWVLLAFIFRALLGQSGKNEQARAPAKPRSEMEDLAGAGRQIVRMAQMGLVDDETRSRLVSAVNARRGQLLERATESSPAEQPPMTTEVPKVQPDPAPAEMLEVFDAEVIPDSTEPEAPEPIVKSVAKSLDSAEPAPSDHVAVEPGDKDRAQPTSATPADQQVEPAETGQQPAPVEPSTPPPTPAVPAVPAASTPTSTKPATAPDRPTPAQPKKPAAAPPAPAPPPRPSRRSFSEVLATFMEEKNIRWGELVGGLLIVGCSIALVVSLREQLEAIPYFRFFIFGGVTAALFGIGLYTEHRWKLESTSRALLIISTLLVPLNFLGMAWLSEEGSFAYAMTTGAIALGVFAALVELSARVIVPHGRYLTALGVVGNSALLLVLSRLVGRETTTGVVLALGCLPVACHAVALGGFLRTLLPHKILTEGQVKELFVLLGTVSFATLAAFGVLVFRTGRGSAELDPVAPLISLMALPVVACGMIAASRLRQSQAVAGWRTGGIGVALSGLLAMLVAVAFAWPQPSSLVLVTLLNFVGITLVAFRYGLPGAHGPALACLSVGYLTSFHWLYGNLDVPDGMTQGHVLKEAILSIQSGTAAVGLFVALALASEWIGRRWRGHSAWYAAGAGVVAVFSLALVTFEGIRDSSAAVLVRTMIVYGVYGVGALALNLRWRRASATYVGAGLLIGATMWALAWQTSEFSAIWPALLAAEALMMSLCAVWIQRGRQSEAKIENAGRDHTAAGQSWWRGYGKPLARTAEVVSWAAIGMGIWIGWSQRLGMPWSAWHIVTGGCLAASYLALLATWGRADLAQVAGGLIVGTAVAAAGWAGTFGQIDDLAVLTALCVAAVAAFQAAIAVSIGVVRHQGQDKPPWDNRDVPATPWWNLLATEWLHVAMGAVGLATVLTLCADTWTTSALPHFTALFAAIACLLSAWGYRLRELSWVGSTFVLAGLIHVLVCRYPDLVTHPWSVALILHATIALLAGGIIGRWLEVKGALTQHTEQAAAHVDRLLLRPVIDSGLLTSVLALPATLSLVRDWEHALPTAVNLVWLATIWFIVAWVRRWRPLFGAAQAALTAAVLFATTSWLADQTWVDGAAERLLDPWSLQIYGIALGILSLAWVVLRIVLARNEGARQLFIDDPQTVDRYVLLTVVFGQLILAALGVLPGIAEELAMSSNRAASIEGVSILKAHTSGAGGWALLAVTAVALATALWSRWRNGEILASLAVVVTAGILIAAPFGSAVATASALRWTLAIVFLVISAALWFRQSLQAFATSLRARLALDEQSSPAAAALVLMTTVAPVIVLTVLAVTMDLAGRSPLGPTGGVFARIPLAVSYLVPLVLIVLGMVGYAIRERSSSYAFSGGIISTGAVVGGYLLLAPRIEFVLSVQLFTIASAGWAILWLIAQRWLDVWREESDDPQAGPLMTLQLALPTVGNLFLLLSAFFLLAFFGPLPRGLAGATEFVLQAGSAFGWAGLVMTVVAWSLRNAVRHRPPRPEVIGLAGLAVMGLLACTIAQFGDAWGYITLMVGWAMYALAVVSATWYIAERKYAHSEPPRALLRLAATWVRVPAILAVVLGLKGAVLHELPLWSAAAIAVASASGAAMAVWRRREGWAFSAGLGVNLAASMVFIDQFPATGAAWWINLFQANMIASAVVGLVWLAARRRLYGGSELSLRSGPLLGVQVYTVLAAQVATLCVPVFFLLVDPATATSELADIARPIGWAAWALAFTGTFWYGWQVARHLIVHVFCLLLATAGVMAACVSGNGWAAYHVLLVAWGTAGAVMLAVDLSVQRLGNSSVAGETKTTLGASLSRIFSSESLQMWTAGVAWMAALFALRGGWEDPDGPYWSAGLTLLAAVLTGVTATRQAAPILSGVSGLLLCVAGSLVWWHELPHTLANFVHANAFALSVGSIVWALIIAIRPSIRPAVRLPQTAATYPQSASLLAMLAIASSVGYALLGDMQIVAEATMNTRLAWSALAVTGLALLSCLHQPPHFIARGGLYGVGLTAVALLIHQQKYPAERTEWCLGWSLAAYALLAATIDTVTYSNQRTRRWLHAGHDEPRSGATDWFNWAQVVLCAVVVPLSIWTSLDFPSLSLSIAGPLAGAAILATGWLRAERSRMVTRDAWQFFVLGASALALAETGWASWHYAATRWLEGSIVLMTALGAIAVLCGWLSSRWLAADSSWNVTTRRATPVFGTLGLATLVLVLVQEAMYRDPVSGPPVALAAVLLVAATLVALMVECLVLALSERVDPFGLSGRGRQAYVYGLEVLIAVLCFHFWCTKPEWFRLGYFEDYWLFWMMVIAFGGAGLAQLFQNRGVPVLAEPLQRTALALPMLPAVGYWLPVETTTSPLLWFLVAAFYAYQAYVHRSLWWAGLSAMCGNLGLWVVWHQWEISFFESPQLWLIPPALVTLVAEYLNHDRLSKEQSATVRYLALSVLYISSTADMFIAGVGNSLWLPLVLASLAVAGVLAGIMLRVRAFLLQGVAFLVVVVMTMIWYAAVDLQHTWVWFVCGIALGIAIITLFAVFEKRRNDVLATIEQLRSWD